jgi:hypothetical protein
MRLLSLVLLLASAGSAAAQPAFSGFRSAQFGMTEAEVREAIVRDFPGSAKAISANDPGIEPFRVLAVPLIRLNPGPTPATVAYAFRGGRLQQIDITWAVLGAATATQREGLIVASRRLGRFFASLPTKPPFVITNAIVSPTNLLVYGARDERGASVEVLAEGVPITYATPDTGTITSVPAGPAVLRISYRAPPQEHAIGAGSSQPTSVDKTHDSGTRDSSTVARQ